MTSVIYAVPETAAYADDISALQVYDKALLDLTDNSVLLSVPVSTPIKLIQKNFNQLLSLDQVATQQDYAAKGISESFSVLSSDTSKNVTVYFGKFSTAARTKELLPGAECEFGGITVETGIDSNRNGILDDDEVDQAENVCHGIDGLKSIVNTSLEAIGDNCAHGGVKVESGLDLDSNDLLEASEVTATSYVCGGYSPTIPALLSTNPVNGSTGVAVNTTITAAFNRAMDAASFTSATFYLSAYGLPISATISYGNQVATLTPAVELSAFTTYTVNVTTGVTDANGNPLALSYIWTFESGSGIPDTTSPTVGSMIPGDSAVGVPRDSSLSATFDEAIDPGTVNSSNVSVTYGNPVLTLVATIAASGNSIIITPAAPLTADTVYTVTVKGDDLAGGGVKDLSGNLLANDHIWSFTTQAVTFGTPLLLDTTADSIGGASVDIDASGDALLVYYAFPTAGNILRSRSYSKATDSWSTATTITSTGIHNYDMDMNSTGAAIISYSVGTTGYARKFTLAGGWEAEQLLKTSVYAGNTSTYNRVAIDEFGNALINFNVLVNGCKGSCTSWWEVQTVRYTPAGWGAATQQTTSGNHAYTYPGVKIDSTGKGLAVHRDDNANYSSMTFNGSWGSRLDNITGTTTASGGVLKMSPSGVGVLSYRTPSTGQSNLYTLTYNAGAWDTPVQMNTDITTPISCNQIEIDPAGNVISVWIQNNGTRDQLFAVRYDASAGTWGTVTPIDDLSAGAASTCGIKTDKSGNMTAYWLQNDGSVNNVYLSRYDISSSSWSLPQIIDNLTTNAMKPRLALNDEGEGLIVWAQDDGTGVFNLHGSFAR